MTAVAPPPQFQSITARTGWSNSNGTASNNMNASFYGADEFSKRAMPRRAAQRSNSSSSLSSQASTGSSASTISASAANINGGPAANGQDWGTKKRPARSLWPAGGSKAEAISGISTARPQSIASTTGPSAASAMTALHTPSSMLPSQNGSVAQTQSNGVQRGQNNADQAAMLWLSPMNGTFERKQIGIPFYPDVVRIGRQTNNKTQPQTNNGYFDSKVLSRQHAEVWADRSGKIWIRDVKSSNGTFVNGRRLSAENKDSDPHELREQDLLELGIDIIKEDQKTIEHHKVAAKIELAGFYTSNPTLMDLDLDAAAANGVFGGGQDMGVIRGRSASQGSIGNNGRLGVAGMNGGVMSLGQQRQPMWLQTITMDQVVKKVNADYKLARQQADDVKRTTGFIDSIIHANPKKEKSAAPGLKQSPVKENKLRFSEPPAPPPQQPLPEKPDTARNIENITQPFLRRTDTERPKLISAMSSPSRVTSIVDGNQVQITTLMEALSAAKREIEVHNARIKEVEEQLAQERTARESAEERADQLEKERPHPTKEPAPDVMHEMNGAPVLPLSLADTPNGADETPSELQQRLEQVLAEMNEMKTSMEKYRTRAEKAEEESSRDRKSLAEMIEKARRDEEKRAAREEKLRVRQSRSTSTLDSLALSGTTIDGSSDGELAQSTELSEMMPNGDAVSSLLEKAGLQNGRPVTPEQYKQLQDAVSQALTTKQQRGDQLAQAAPYATIVGVVFAGLALMSYLNGWQKIDR